MFLITCEHGGNIIPKEYKKFFSEHEEVLKTHLGYDAGALETAKRLAKAFSAELVSSTTSRLLIELNRSLNNPCLFSKITRNLPNQIKQQIIERYYLPYWKAVETYISKKSRVIHLSAHSFTPELNGIRRKGDIGLLYDPSRTLELNLCKRWQALLKQQLPGFVIRRNYPYLGKSDGITTAMRHRFPKNSYLGIEIEINQKHFFGGARSWSEINSALIKSLRLALG